ncbi:MAG: hypothetical protein AB8G23_06590 [Myxococcota bacterium]
MILRGLATLALLGLLGLNWLLPTQSWSARGSESQIRTDFDSNLAIGKRLPPLELRAVDGLGLEEKIYTRDDLEGHRVLLTFERSVDW